MCGRRSDFTTRPQVVAAPSAASRADSITDRPIPDPTSSAIQRGGPFDAGFGYRVTEEGLKALEEYEQRHGKPALRRLPLPDTVAEALATEAEHEARHRRRKEARARGRRMVTVCSLNRGRQEVQDLRLRGQWLERAGFHLGRQCEIEVSPGTLTIRAV
jgi:hypothetical protein